MKENPPELGERIAFYTGHRLKRKDLWWILLGCLLWVVPLVYAGWLFRKYELENGVLAAYYWIQPFIMLAYLAFLILGTWLTYRIWSAKRFVGVYQNGLRWRLKGFRVHHLIWSDLEGIACATTERVVFLKSLREEHQAVLYRKNKPAVAIDNRIEDYNGLIEIIKAQFYPTIFPNLLASFQNGQRLQFGPIAIQKSSFYIARAIPQNEFPDRPYQAKAMNSFAWAQLTDLSVNSGFLMVKSGNSKMKKIPVSQIPNFEILLKIVEQGVTI